MEALYDAHIVVFFVALHDVCLTRLSFVQDIRLLLLAGNEHRVIHLLGTIVVIRTC